MIKEKLIDKELSDLAVSLGFYSDDETAYTKDGNDIPTCSYMNNWLRLRYEKYITPCVERNNIYNAYEEYDRERTYWTFLVIPANDSFECSKISDNVEYESYDDAMLGGLKEVFRDIYEKENKL
jgi:hypothetical protein